MRFVCAITYDVVTPESAEQGDYAESGYIDEAREFDSLRDLIDCIENGGFNEGSDSGPAPCWLSQSDARQDWQSGAETTESIHLDKISERNRARITRLLKSRAMKHDARMRELFNERKG